MSHRTLDEYLKQTTPTTTKHHVTKPKYRITGFYKETQFQETPIGKIPKQWKIVRIKDVILLVRNGYVYRNFNREGRGIPVTRIETISEEKIDISKLAYVENISKKDIFKYKLKNGDILFSHINSEKHIGKTAIYEGQPELLVHGMNLLLIRPNINVIYPRFLLYIIRFYRIRKIFFSIAKRAVNQASINQTQLSNLKIFYPPLEEQWGIAEVLSSVDEAIEATERLIGRLERLKRGLMQELLTKGIGHREYKQTPIGEIPKEWQIVKLQSVIVKSIGGGTPSTKNPRYWNGNIPWMTSVGIPEDNIYITKGERFITEEGLKHSTTNIVPKGNLIVATRVGLGKAGVNLIDIAINQDLVGLILDKKRVITEFVAYYLRSPKALTYIISAARGTTIKGISKQALFNLKIPLPPLEEQRRIITMLSVVDEWIKLEKKYKKKFERLKRGLMELLLTGRVRVRVKRIDSAEDSSNSERGG